MVHSLNKGKRFERVIAEWLSKVTPHVHEILPVNRMSQLMVQKHTSDCVFRID